MSAVLYMHSIFVCCNLYQHIKDPSPHYFKDISQELNMDESNKTYPVFWRQPSFYHCWNKDVEYMLQHSAALVTCYTITSWLLPPTWDYARRLLPIYNRNDKKLVNKKTSVLLQKKKGRGYWQGRIQAPKKKLKLRDFLRCCFRRVFF